MLRRFEVENYRCFSEKLVFDLTSRDYSFNQNLVYNGIVNKAIIYGKNGIGKSVLGFALLILSVTLQTTNACRKRITETWSIWISQWFFATFSNLETMILSTNI